MLQLPGYLITKQVTQTSYEEVYLGVIDEKEKRPCLIKHLHLKNPSSGNIAKLKQIYKNLHNLSSPNILEVYELREQTAGLVLIFAETPLFTIETFLEQEQPSLALSLQIGITLAATLQHIHQANIIHGGIKPSNILIHPDTYQPKLWDFGLFTLIAPTINFYDSHFLTTALPYISPEQSGRAHQTIDYRTDLYSLGVVLYEMLTGQPPFSSTDPLEMIHSHLARTPEPLSSTSPEIPQAVSDIVLKLLAKEPESRYQSGKGLRIDLENCQQQLLDHGEIRPFPLAQHDQVSKLLMSQKLYGRNQEIARLQKAFQSATEGETSIVFVSGEAGIGKSTLIKEFNAQTIQNEYFITGKYEQLKRTHAYNGVLQAIQDFVRQILTESPESIAKWKTCLTSTVGNNIPIFVGLIPEIGQLLDPPAKTIPATSTNPNQLHHLFEQLVKAIATQAHPLVIFLDDLQWADLASLDLIQHLMLSSAINHTLFIITYRNDELHALHPLQTTINTLEENQLSVQTIKLQSIDKQAVNQWIADTLAVKPHKTVDFSELIYQKAGGNPFFIKFFLHTLYEEDILDFDDQIGWHWDLQSGRLLEVTDNVVNLMVERVNMLPSATQLVLNLAACVGSKFTLDILAGITNFSEESTYLHLEPAITAGMVIQIEGNAFRFAHDRIQQAIYSMLNQEQQQKMHWQIGNYWLHRYQIGQGDSEIFAIVDQLNLGYESSEAQPNYLELLQLNLEAGRKAKMSAAYQTAYEYLTTVLHFSYSYPNGWIDYYDQWLDLYNEAVETAYLSGHFTEMDQLIPIILSHVKTVFDKEIVAKTQIQAHLSKNQLPEATQVGREVLAELGITLPEGPTQDDFAAGYQHIQMLLAGRDIDSFVESPPMQDQTGLMAMQILSAISTAVWSLSSILYAIDVFTRVELSLTLGNAPTSAAAYAGFGVIVCSQIGDVVTGYHFGQLALKIFDKYQIIAHKARTYGTVYAFTFHWHEHLSKSLPHFLEGHQSGVDVGDFSFATSNAYLYARHGYYSGQNLTLLQQRIKPLTDSARQLKQDRSVYILNMYQQVCENLQTEVVTPSRLVGSFYDEDKIFELYQTYQDKNRMTMILCSKLVLAYLFAEYEEALRLTKQIKADVDSLSASIYLAIFTFYDSLTYLATYAQHSPTRQKEILTRITANQKKLSYWAKHAPMNFRHKWLLVEAECAVVKQNEAQAREYYDQAIELAKRNGYIQDEGLANELAAKFYDRRKQTSLAQYYMNLAMDCYGRWGASNKERQLIQTYPHLIQAEDLDASPAQNQMIDKSILDYVTILKATRILSEELILENVLEKLMHVVLENAGAQTGYLILPRGKQLNIEASVTIDTDQVKLLMAQPINESTQVASSVIEHVVRTKKPILLHDAAHESAFIHDPNIMDNATKSLLCMPIQRQKNILGILYLENNLTTHAFTEERIELLQILLGQAAISLQNAIYYESLKQEIEERKDAEDRLRASESEWRSLVDNAPDTILIVDKNMRVRFVNRLIPSLREEDVIGELVYNFVAPEDQETVKRSVQYVLTNGMIDEYETSGPGEEGLTNWYSTRVGPIFQKEEVAGVILVATDITKRRETEDKLRLYMAELERSNRELQEFAYVSSHDLQEPLRKIQAFGNRLESKYKHQLDERGLDYLQRMQNAAARMQTLIEDLLAFSRVSTQALPFQQVDLNEAIQKALLNLELPIAQTNAQVEVAPLHQIEADGLQMVQLFQNLISNALKFHRHDTPLMIKIADELIIESPLSVPSVRITVVDNGIGFEEQYAERIFGVFQRLHSRKQYEGTGVGLAICRKITDRHHGQISAASVLGQGTTITLLLPQSQADLIEEI